MKEFSAEDVLGAAETCQMSGKMVPFSLPFTTQNGSDVVSMYGLVAVVVILGIVVSRLRIPSAENMRYVRWARAQNVVHDPNAVVDLEAYDAPQAVLSALRKIEGQTPPLATVTPKIAAAVEVEVECTSWEDRVLPSMSTGLIRNKASLVAVRAARSESAERDTQTKVFSVTPVVKAALCTAVLCVAYGWVFPWLALRGHPQVLRGFDLSVPPVAFSSSDGLLHLRPQLGRLSGSAGFWAEAVGVAVIGATSVQAVLMVRGTPFAGPTWAGTALAVLAVHCASEASYLYDCLYLRDSDFRPAQCIEAVLDLNEPGKWTNPVADARMMALPVVRDPLYVFDKNSISDLQKPYDRIGQRILRTWAYAAGAALAVLAAGCVYEGARATRRPLSPSLLLHRAVGRSLGNGSFWAEYAFLLTGMLAAQYLVTLRRTGGLAPGPTSSLVAAAVVLVLHFSFEAGGLYSSVFGSRPLVDLPCVRVPAKYEAAVVLVVAAAVAITAGIVAYRAAVENSDQQPKDKMKMVNYTAAGVPVTTLKNRPEM